MHKNLLAVIFGVATYMGLGPIEVIRWDGGQAGFWTIGLVGGPVVAHADDAVDGHGTNQKSPAKAAKKREAGVPQAAPQPADSTKAYEFMSPHLARGRGNTEQDRDEISADVAAGSVGTKDNYSNPYFEALARQKEELRMERAAEKKAEVDSDRQDQEPQQ